MGSSALGTVITMTHPTIPNWLSGSGSGDGYGSGYYWTAVIDGVAMRLPEPQRERLASLKEQGALIAYWRSDAKGRPANGGSCPPVAPGVVHTEPGPLRNDCGPGQLHATRIPPKWSGERWWLVAMIGDVRGDDDKYWGLHREIIGECL